MATTQITNSIITNLYPQIKKVMDSKSSTFRTLVGNFMKKHSDQLYDIVPCDRIYFLEDEVEELRKIVGKNTYEIATDAIRKTYFYQIADFNPRCAKDETTLILLMIVNYFNQKGNKKDIELACIYLAFSGKMYASVHSGIFKYLPSRNVMEYILNFEMNSKFDIVSQGSVLGAIRSLTTTWISTYGKILKSADDEEIKDILQQLRDRIKAMLLKIAKLYYAAYEDKDKYLAYDTDSMDPDNYHMSENNSVAIDRYVESAMSYITTNAVNYKFVKLSTDANIQFDELKSILETIQGGSSENIKLIKELINVIIVLYSKYNNNLELRSMAFVTYTISPKPNAKDPIIIRQNEIIVQLLSDNSARYTRRKSRESTKNSYHRSILSYYALVINYVAGQ